MKRFDYYPGHMAKTKRELKEKLKWADIVYEVVDARGPVSTRNADLDGLVGKKPRFILMNKADLANKEEVDRFASFFASEGLKALPLQADSKASIRRILPATETYLEELSGPKTPKHRTFRPFRALVVGIPNVGKSTIINRLVEKRVTAVGDTPNITRHLQVVRIHDKLELIDSPGVLWPKIASEATGLKLALLGALKDHLIPKDEVVIHGFKLLKERYPEAFRKRYDLESIDMETVALFDAIGRRMGCIQKGGGIDYDRVMDRFLHDFRHKKFGRIMVETVEDL